MKQKLFLLALFWVFCFSSIVYGQDYVEESGVATYLDKIPDGVIRREKNVENIRKVRYVRSNDLEIKSRLGNFIVDYNEDVTFLTEGIKHCIKLALDVWEEKIVFKKPVKIHIYASCNMDTTIAIATTVGYTRKRDQNFSIPDNLFIQDNNAAGVSINDTIKINTSVDWNSAWPTDGKENGTVSLLTGLLRNICRVLGFGCSVVERSSGVSFSVLRTPSVFDKLMFNGDTYLSSLSHALPARIKSFFTKNVRLKSDTFEYNLYNTNGFVNGISGNYFSLGYANLMEYPINEKSCLLPINDEVLNVLEKIGWNVQKHDRHIVCDNSDTLGFGSAYKTYKFTLNDKTEGRTNRTSWKFQVFDTPSCTYQTVSTYNGELFTVQPAIKDNSLDNYNCMQARVVATADGTDYYFPLSLDVLPLVQNIKICNIDKIDNQCYKFDVTIDQLGATDGYVLASDDLGNTINCDFTSTDKPINVSGLFIGYTAYIDITLRNKYGVTDRFICQDICPRENSLSTQMTSSVMPINMLHGINKQKTILHDGDNYEMRTNCPEEEIDSVEWRLCLDGWYRPLAKKIGREKSYTFEVTPDNIDCVFMQDYGSDIIKVNTGMTWRCSKQIPNQDGMYFLATIYTHDSNGQRSQDYRFADFVFDVLPSEPTTEVLDVWVDKCDEDWPLVKIKTSADHCESMAVSINQYEGPTDYIYSLFDYDYGNEYTIELAGWRNKFYCTAFNKYGRNTGPKISVRTASVNNIGNSEFTVTVDGYNMRIVNGNPFNIAVFNTDGTIIYKSVHVQRFSERFAPGFYIVNLYDSVTKSTITKKIIIK